MSSLSFVSVYDYLFLFLFSNTDVSFRDSGHKILNAKGEKEKYKEPKMVMN